MTIPASTPPPRYADIETASDDYARRFAGATGAWLLSQQTRLVLAAIDRWRLAHPGREPRVLDVGGGHGQVALPLIGAGIAVTVAVSGAPYQQGLKALESQGRCSVVEADLLNLPWAERHFDIVTSVRLLPHFDSVPQLIAELSRVASDYVVVDYPTPSSVSALTPWLFSAKKRLEGNTRTYEMFQHDYIAGAFGAVGFVPTCRNGEFFWPMVVHRQLKNPTVSAFLEQWPRSMGLTDRFGSPVIAVMARKE